MSDQTPAAPARAGRQRRRQRQEIEPPPVVAVEKTPTPEATRPPVRTEVRDVFRLDPRAAAAERARQIMEHGGLDNIEGTDKYYIDKTKIPDGWTYEWKTHTVYGMENPAYQVGLQRTGWKPVPASRHPEMMPKGWSGEVIELDGQILMERPQVITDMITKADKKRARDQVRVKEQQLSSAASKDQMPRSADQDGDPRTAPKISRSYEPMPIPNE